MYMCGPPTINVIAPGIGARLNRAEVVVALFVGQRTSAASKVWVDRSKVSIIFVAIPPAIVAEQKVNETIRQVLAVRAESLRWDNKALSGGTPPLAIFLTRRVVERAVSAVAEAWAPQSQTQKLGTPRVRPPLAH